MKFTTYISPTTAETDHTTRRTRTDSGVHYGMHVSLLRGPARHPSLYVKYSRTEPGRWSVPLSAPEHLFTDGVQEFLTAAAAAAAVAAAYWSAAVGGPSISVYSAQRRDARKRIRSLTSRQ